MQKNIYQVIKTKNGQIGYCKIGTGRPLVMLVGYSGTLFHWNKEFIGKLSQDFTLYLVDNRLIGKSNSNNLVNIDGFATDVHDFIVALGLEQPYLFGWSMGGVIAQRVAVNYPKTISKLILLATVPSLNCTAPEFAYLLENSDNIAPDVFKSKLYEIFFSRPMSDELKEMIGSNKAISIENYHYRFTTEARHLQDMALANSKYINESSLVNVDIPTLIFQAKNDRAIISESAFILNRAIAKSKMVIYDDGGHFCVHVQPIEMALDIYNFLTYNN